MIDRYRYETMWVYLFPVVILCYTFSLFWGWFPQTHSIATLLVGWFACIFISMKYVHPKQVVYLVIYTIILILNVFAEDHRYSSYRSVFDELTVLLMPSLMFYGIINNNKKVLNFTVVSVLVMLMINAVGSAFVDLIFPGSIRALNYEVKMGNKELVQSYYRYGVANYYLPHAVPTIIPVLVMGIKSFHKEKRKRLICFLGLVSCLALVYFSGAAAALILGVLAFFVSLFTLNMAGNIKKPLFLLLVIGIVLIPIISNNSLMLSFLDWADSAVGHEGYFHSKITDFQELLLYNESTGDIEAREDHYMTTINAIISNPLLGSNEEIGGHSTLLEHWGDLGLVGFIPYLLFIISQIKLSSKYLQEGTKLFFYEGVFFAFMMFLVKHIDEWETWLFLFTVLPLLTHYIEINEQKSLGK